MMATASPQFESNKNPAEHLFEPDTLAVFQYAETFRQGPFLAAEKVLLLAILEDALDCFRKYLSAREDKQREFFREAESWIFQEDRDWPMSFANICEVLGVDPEYLRAGLMEWKERKLSEPQPALRRSRTKRRNNDQKKRGIVPGGEKRDIDRSERGSGRRQPELTDGGRARSAAGSRLAAV